MYAKRFFPPAAAVMLLITSAAGCDSGADDARNVASQQAPDNVSTADGAPRTPDASLTETYWKLISIEGTPVKQGEDQREAHIKFRESGEVQGNTGCNSFNGSFTVDEERLQLGLMAMTMMACPDSMANEQAFTEALGRVNRYATDGDTLVLFDTDNAVLRFEAVYF